MRKKEAQCEGDMRDLSLKNNNRELPGGVVT